MKKNFRSLLVMLLCLALMLSLAACGKQQEETKPEETSQEMVYTADVLTLNPGDLKNGINPAVYTEDGFYGLSYGVIAKGEIPDGATEEYEGQYDIWGNRIFFVSYDGQVKELKGYQPMDPVPDPGDKLNFSSGSNLDSLLLDSNGNLIAVEYLYTNWFDGTEEELDSMDSWAYWDKYRSTAEYYLRRLDSEGAELSSSKLDFETENAWLDFSRSQFDADGNLLVISDYNLLAYAPDGSLSFQIESEDWINSILKQRDGSIAVLKWGDNGHMGLYPIDFEKKSFGEPVKLPDEAYNPMPGDENYDLYYVNGMYLYGYKLETEEKTKILNWLDVDVNGDNLGRVYVKADGSVIGVLNQWKNDTAISELITVHQVPADSVPKKETLTLAVMWGNELYDKVIDFNRHSDTVRIQVIDYSEYNDYENEDYDAGRTKLLTEVMSGSMPDMIALSQLPYAQMAAKGLLEDLYPYMDKDPDMKREDFFPNVLQALEVNGGLYEICPSFNVQTLMGATSVVGDKPGWNYEQFKAALATMPEGCEPMDQYTTRDSILQSLLFADLDHYVDWTTGKCNFDSKDFIEMLEFAATFPATIPDDMEWEETNTRIAEGRQMLTQAYLYSVDSMLWNDVQFGEAGATYIGYPTNNGVGSVMQMDSGYGMSASCKNKEAAWEFLRSFLTEDAQKNVYNIPINVKVYQEMLKEAMTPEYEKDENGNIMLDENGEKIQVSWGGYMTEDGEMHYIYAMTQEQADKLWEAITTCTKIQNYDINMYNIVIEQAQAFFDGQKTAEEVARLIQSKANIYVNEQR